VTKADVLFLTDAQVAERIGVTTDEFKQIAPALEGEGFPVKDAVFFRRRYWPAIQAFLDQRYNLRPSSVQGIPALDGEETWN
jgi:hypothetical protein